MRGAFKGIARRSRPSIFARLAAVPPHTVQPVPVSPQAVPPLVVLIGVSGSGKTLIGTMLARALGVPFADADDLHPAANVRKMATGHPLDDEDRWPWLRKVGVALVDAEATGLVMACSALKRSYRDLLTAAAPRAEFVLLDGPRALLEERLSHRQGHFMPSDLLDSQLATLERLQPDEPGFTVSVDATPETIVADIRAKLHSL